MIIWRGKGLAILAIAFVALLLAQLVTDALWPYEHYYQNHGWPKLIGFWTAAAILYALNPWLGVGQKQELWDKATGQTLLPSIARRACFLCLRDSGPSSSL